MKIKCSNCGKKVPFGGNVCPWCKADKSADQTKHAILLASIFIPTFLGLWLFGGWGMLIGLILGSVAGVALGSMATQKN